MAQDIRVNGVTMRGVETLRVPKADGSGNAVYKDASNLVSPIDIKGIFAGTVTEIDDINGEITGAVGTRVLNNNDTLQSLVLPEATSIGSEAARYCDNLKYVKMDKCTSVGYRAFRECPRLEEVDFPLATSLADDVFEACYALKTCNFPLVQSVGSYCFYGCNKLERLSLPSCKTLNHQAFYNCSLLESLNIPEVTALNGSDIFSGCAKLKSLSMPKVNSFGSDYTFRGTYIETVTLPAYATGLRYRAFRDATRVKTVTAPEATSINEECFYGASGLQHVSAPKATWIGRESFRGCTSLASLELPALTSISDQNVFNGCTALAELVLSNENRVVTLGHTNDFTNTPIASGTGYVYVPLKWIDFYKKGTNWTTYKDQIVTTEEKEDNTISRYKVSVIRGSNMKPMCQYITEEGTFYGRDRHILGKKVNDEISYRLSVPGYVDKTGTISLAAATSIDIEINAESWTADNNFNGTSIFKYDFTKLEPDYANLAAINYGNYADYYHNISEDGIGAFSASKFFGLTITQPDISGMTNPTFIWEAVTKFSEGDGRVALYSMGGSNTNTGIIAIGATGINHYANGNRTIVENLDLVGEHHIALAVTSAKVHLFIDGTLQGSYDNTYLFNGMKYTTPRIGNNQSSTGEYFRGKVKELALTVRDIEDPTDAEDCAFLLSVSANAGE